VESGKASITIKKHPTDDAKDQVKWKWAKGSATDPTEFGDPTDPLANNGYALCIYNFVVNASVRVSAISLPPGGTCGTKPCWKAKPTGFTYKDKLLTPDGALSAAFKGKGSLFPGKAQVKVTAKGSNIQMPDLNTFTTGPITVQAQRADGGICFEAVYSSPFKKNEDGKFVDKAD
jgi:hypothetical protein